MAVYATYSGRLEMLVTSPHIDVITSLATDPGCYRKSAQLCSSSQYIITGSRDGSACVWNFGVVPDGSRRGLVRQDRATIDAVQSDFLLMCELTKQQKANIVTPSGSRLPSGYPAAMQEEMEACISQAIPFDESMLDCGFGSKLVDLPTFMSRRGSSLSVGQNQHLSRAKGLAKVLRVFPSDGSGQPVTHVALYLSLDVAMCASQGSDVIRIFSVMQGVWARSVSVIDGIPIPLEMPTEPLALPVKTRPVCVNHVLIHSPSVSFFVQWTLKTSVSFCKVDLFFICQQGLILL